MALVFFSGDAAESLWMVLVEAVMRNSLVLLPAKNSLVISQYGLILWCTHSILSSVHLLSSIYLWRDVSNGCAAIQRLQYNFVARRCSFYSHKLQDYSD